MANSTRKIIAKIMAYYRKLVENPEEGGVWEKRRFGSKDEANAFFVGVMLDRGQPADRAWDGGWHLVSTHFQRPDFWNAVNNTRLTAVTKIIRTGYEGMAYGRYITAHAKGLKSAAKLIIEKYEGDVRNIWKGVKSKDVDLIYRRFHEVYGIGDALAKMAQFILVRSYGVAGGEQSKSFMSVKPDVHICRVTHRLGLTSQEKPKVVAKEIEALHLDSPADFDLATFRIGQGYCFKTSPDCNGCPLRKVCAYAEEYGG